MLLRRSLFAAALSLLFLFAAQAADDTVKLKPFVLAALEEGDMTAVVEATKQKLTAAGFEVVGDYSPYPDATIIGISNAQLKAAAGQTDYGIFAAALRVTVSKGQDGKLQIAYTNPVYLANAYRLESDLSGVADELKKALGMLKTYGSEEGLSIEKLRDYQYKWLMPYFNDRLNLATYRSYDAAVKGVEAALAAGKGGAQKVYRVDLADKETSLFGVFLTESSYDECAGDKYIMNKIDFGDIKSTGHLPYDIVVKGNRVYALRAEFRIAISFPDLSMMGSNSFASIMCAPSALENSLTLAAGGKLSEE